MKTGQRRTFELLLRKKETQTFAIVFFNILVKKYEVELFNSLYFTTLLQTLYQLE